MCKNNILSVKSLILKVLVNYKRKEDDVSAEVDTPE